MRIHQPLHENRSTPEVVGVIQSDCSAQVSFVKNLSLPLSRARLALQPNVLPEMRIGVGSITRRVSISAPGLQDAWQAFARIDGSIGEEVARTAHSLASLSYLASTTDGNTGAIDSMADLRLATDRLGGDLELIRSRRAKYEGLVVGGPNPSLSLIIHVDRYGLGLTVSMEINAPQDIADQWLVPCRSLIEARIRELSAIAVTAGSTTRRRRWRGRLARIDADLLHHPTWSAVIAGIVLTVLAFLVHLIHLI